MTYNFQQNDGPSVTVENDGDQTTVQLQSGGSGQGQSQSTGFSTGEWQGRPRLFRQGSDLLLTFQTNQGAQGVRISGNQIQHVSGEQKTSGAEELKLQEGGSISRMKPMEPMKPMKPMAPMKPMGH
jgi:hypothetical protein